VRQAASVFSDATAYAIGAADAPAVEAVV
jgi:hypothetical protein